MPPHTCNSQLVYCRRAKWPLALGSGEQWLGRLRWAGAGAEADRRQVQVVRQFLHSGGGVGLPQTTAGGGSAAKSQRSQRPFR